MEAIQREAVPSLQVEIAMMSAMASTPNPSVGECLKADLDTGVGAESRSLDLWVARIPLKVVAAMWLVHQLWEILLPPTLRVSGYSEKPAKQKRLSHV
jgi:hypothetical protein